MWGYATMSSYTLRPASLPRRTTFVLHNSRKPPSDRSGGPVMGMPSTWQRRRSRKIRRERRLAAATYRPRHLGFAGDRRNRAMHRLHVPVGPRMRRSNAPAGFGEPTQVPPQVPGRNASPFRPDRSRPGHVGTPPATWHLTQPRHNLDARPVPAVRSKPQFRPEETHYAAAGRSRPRPRELSRSSDGLTRLA